MLSIRFVDSSGVNPLLHGNRGRAVVTFVRVLRDLPKAIRFEYPVILDQFDSRLQFEQGASTTLREFLDTPDQQTTNTLTLPLRQHSQLAEIDRFSGLLCENAPNQQVALINKKNMLFQGFYTKAIFIQLVNRRRRINTILLLLKRDVKQTQQAVPALKAVIQFFDR